MSEAPRLQILSEEDLRAVLAYLEARPEKRNQLLKASHAYNAHTQFLLRNTERRGSFDAMLASVREYPDILEIVPEEEFERIRGPGQALWDAYPHASKNNSRTRFAIVPYAEDAHATLAYAGKVMEHLPKWDARGNVRPALFSSAWMNGILKGFPSPSIQVRSRFPVRKLRCEIIDCSPSASTGDQAHLGMLFAYEQDGSLTFLQDYSLGSLDYAAAGILPTLELGIDVACHGTYVKLGLGSADNMLRKRFGRSGIYADAEDVEPARNHTLPLIMGESKHLGEYLRPLLPGTAPSAYVRPRIIETT